MLNNSVDFAAASNDRGDAGDDRNSKTWANPLHLTPVK